MLPNGRRCRLQPIWWCLEASTLLDQLELLFAKDHTRIFLNHRALWFSLSFSDLFDWNLEWSQGKTFEIVQRRSLALGWKRKLLYHCQVMGWMWKPSWVQDKVKDTILIATRNEGKTKRCNMFESWALKVKKSATPGTRSRRDRSDLWECPPKSWNDCRANWKNSLSGWFRFGGYLGRLTRDLVSSLCGSWCDRCRKTMQELLLCMVFDLKDPRKLSSLRPWWFAEPGKESLVVEADWPGSPILIRQRGHGFGYDPLLLKFGETGRAAAENLTLEEKNTIHHALALLKSYWRLTPTSPSKQTIIVMVTRMETAPLMKAIKEKYLGQVVDLF